MASNCEFLIRRNHWEDTGIDGRIILRCVDWIRLNWLEIGTDGGKCEFLIRRKYWENPAINGRIILRCVVSIRLSWL
jgi:hypothetical protein